MSAFWSGATAGAAGTTVLNVVTYLDMAVRGRGASSSPEELVERVAGRAGVSIPGDKDARNNRVESLGALSGFGVGIAVGAGAGVVRRFLRDRDTHVPTAVAVVVIAAAAMALADVPLKALGISDPKTWALKDWAADVVPHLAYGASTYAALVAADPA